MAEHKVTPIKERYSQYAYECTCGQQFLYASSAVAHEKEAKKEEEEKKDVTGD